MIACRSRTLTVAPIVVHGGELEGCWIAAGWASPLDEWSLIRGQAAVGLVAKKSQEATRRAAQRDGTPMSCCS